MRPEFQFRAAKFNRVNPVTKESEPHLPISQKAVRIFGSTVTVIFFVSLFLALLFGIIVYRVIIQSVFYASSNDEFLHSQARNAEHLLQLLIFPGQMFIKCENARIKRDWLDSIEEMKRKQQEIGALVRQATISARRTIILASIASKTNNMKLDRDNDDDQNSKTMEKPEDLQWLKELVNELQVVISHRHIVQFFIGCRNATRVEKL